MSGKQIDTDHMMSLSEVSKRGVSAMVQQAIDGTPTVIVRHNKPVAVMLPIDAYFDWMARQ